MGSRDVAGGLEPSRSGREWLPLALLLGGLLLAILVTGRVVETVPSGWFGDEAEHYLAAESLARDLDLTWDAKDVDRQAARRAKLAANGSEPAAMPYPLLQGAPPPTLTQSPIYALYLAPFVRLAPARGPALANWLLLALASCLTALELRRRLSTTAPLLVALVVFGSVAFAYVALALPATLLLAAAASAFALAFRHEEPASAELTELYRPPAGAGGHFLRWLVIGGLLGIVVADHPLYSLLLLPAFVALPAERRRSGSVALVSGVLALLLAVGLLSGLDAGAEGWQFAAWSHPARAWELGAADPTLLTEDSSQSVGGVLRERVVEVVTRPQRTLWNLAYALFGANAGVLPFYLPILLLTAAWSGRSGRSTLFLSCVLIAVLFVVLIPFDFLGGPGAVGNRRFLPLFGALWMVPVRPLKRSALALAAVASALLVWPLWLAPAGAPISADGGYRHSTGLVARFLPHETTQRDVASAGEQMRSGLWVRSLGGARPAGDRWKLPGGATAVMLVAAPVELESIFVQFAAGAPAELEVSRGLLGDIILRPDGRVGFDIREPRRRAGHTMWWGREPQQLYVVEFRLPGTSGSFPFTISGVTRITNGAGAS